MASGTVHDLFLDSAGVAGAILQWPDVLQAKSYWYGADIDPPPLPTIMVLFTEDTTRQGLGAQVYDTRPC